MISIICSRFCKGHTELTGVVSGAPCQTAGEGAACGGDSEEEAGALLGPSPEDTGRQWLQV